MVGLFPRVWWGKNCCLWHVMLRASPARGHSVEFGISCARHVAKCSWGPISFNSSPNPQILTTNLFSHPSIHSPIPHLVSSGLGMGPGAGGPAVPKAGTNRCFLELTFQRWRKPTQSAPKMHPMSERHDSYRAKKMLNPVQVWGGLSWGPGAAAPGLGGGELVRCLSRAGLGPIFI